MLESLLREDHDVKPRLTVLESTGRLRSMRSNDELVARAVALAQENAKYFPLARGMVAVHPSEPLAATLKEYVGDDAVLVWPDGRVALFPRAEICDINLVLGYAERLKLSLPVDPTIRLDEHEIGLLCLSEPGPGKN